MSIIEKNGHSDELEHIAPFLAARKKGNAFQPEVQYFETFPMQLQEKIISRKRNSAPQMISSWLQNIALPLKPSFAALAVFIISSGVIYLHMNKPIDYQSDVAVQEYLIDQSSTEDILDMVEVPENKAYKSSDKILLQDYILDNTEESLLSEEI